MGRSPSAPFIIADSSGLVSLATDTDANHQAAVAAAQGLLAVPGTIIVPSDVFSETMNVLERRSSHETALKLASELAEGPFLVVPTERVLQDALAKFARLPASVSFTDCVVMATADAYGTKDIFGFDEAFRKNGYRILPRAARRRTT